MKTIDELISDGQKISTISETLQQLGFEELESDILNDAIQEYKERKEIKEIYEANADNFENISISINNSNLRALLSRSALNAGRNLLSDNPSLVLESAKVIKAIFDAWQSFNKVKSYPINNYAEESIKLLK